MAIPAVRIRPGRRTERALRSATSQATTHFIGSDSFIYKANDGELDSNVATVTISIAPVNDAPSFTAGGNQIVLDNAGPQTVVTWATNISAGPSDEAGQTLNFLVSNNR